MASTNDKGHHGVVLNIVFDAHLENCMKRLCSIFFWKILKEAIKNKEYQSPTNFSEVTSSEFYYSLIFTLGQVYNEYQNLCSTVYIVIVTFPQGLLLA